MSKLFCKHEYEVIHAQTSEDEREHAQGGITIKSKFGVLCFCPKCGKTHKRYTKILTKICRSKIKRQMEEKLNHMSKGR